MFERFTQPAREAVARAQEEARGLGHRYIGCEHLLVALAGAPNGDAAASAMRRAGLSADALRDAVADELPPPGALDARALAAIGIDLDEVRRRVEEAFGPGALERRRPCHPGRRPEQPGALPFTPRSKKALELALRGAVARGDDHIGSEHVLIGVLEAMAPDGPAACALARLGVPPRRLSQLLDPERSA
jgi:ATP-dependent Clp protease ATP-binding subunit ClpA